MSPPPWPVFLFRRGWGVGPSLRASSEHILIVRPTRAHGATPQLLLFSLHRPLLLLPCHLPKHPLIPRTDEKRLFHPLLLRRPRISYPDIHFGAHPPLYLGELR